MIKFLKFSIFSIVSLIVILSIAPFFFDKSVIYEKFEKIVNEKLQKQISFDQNIGLTFFPRPSIIVNNVKFEDQLAGINTQIKRVKVISTWSSIINLEPKIDTLEFFDPLFRFYKNKITYNPDFSKILVNNVLNTHIEKFSLYKKNFNEIIIYNGILNFENNKKLNKFTSVNLNILINENLFKSSGNLFYEDYQVDLDFKIRSNNLKNFDLEFIKTFSNKDEIFTSGEISLDKQSVNFNGKSTSKLLIFSNLIKSSLINLNFFNKKKIYFVNNYIKKIDLILDVEVEKIKFEKISFDNTTFKIYSNSDEILIKNLKSSILGAPFISNLNYKTKDKVFSGYGKFEKFKIEENLFGSTEYDLFDGIIKSDFVFKGKNDKNSFFKFFNAEGNFNTGSIKFKGADFKKISSNFDNAETFADFLNLANKNSWKGFSKIDSIKGKFIIKNGKFFLKDTMTSHNNLKIKTNGRFSLTKDEISVDNLIKVQTKKYQNLPEFGVNFSGGKNNYKISYDLEKIRNQMLTSGLNSILKKQKKIVIDPNSIKKFLKNNNDENSFDPNKIIELFSD